MQDRYAGDIGDYIKLALLIRLSPGHKLGVAWYKTADSANNDGRHISYLNPEFRAEWARYEPRLYERLRLIVDSDVRLISSLETIVPGEVKYHSAPLTRLIHQR